MEEESGNIVQGWIDGLADGWHYVASWESVLDLTLWISSIFPVSDYGSAAREGFFAPDGPYYSALAQILPYLYLMDWIIPVELFLWSLTACISMGLLLLLRGVWQTIRNTRGAF